MGSPAGSREMGRWRRRGISGSGQGRGTRQKGWWGEGAGRESRVQTQVGGNAMARTVEVLTIRKLGARSLGKYKDFRASSCTIP